MENTEKTERKLPSPRKKIGYVLARNYQIEVVVCKLFLSVTRLDLCVRMIAATEEAHRLPLIRQNEKMPERSADQ